MRVRFVDAAEEILIEKGEHELSARVVAARAGQKTQLLYYYFQNMDDLLLAVIRRVNERRLQRFVTALATDEPLRALWDSVNDPAAAVLATELNSVANRRQAVRAEIVSAARQFRALQTAAVRKLLPPAAPGDPPCPAAGIVMIAAALARSLTNEAMLGLTEGHAEARAIVEHYVARCRRSTRDG